MRTIVVTGGNGHFGSQIVINLAEKGYNVVILDRKTGPDSIQSMRNVQTQIVDLTDYDQVLKAMKGGNAVIHMAAIPDPTVDKAQVIFSNNTVSTYNVLESAANLGFSKAVIGSSESAYGFPWAHRPLSPLYFPVDELHPLIPHDPYGTSKAVNELTGQSFFRRTGMQVVSLRLSTLNGAEGYRFFYDLIETPLVLRRVLWSYVDIRDAAEACVLAVEKDGLGCISLNIAADDTFSNIKSADLLQQFFPDVSDIRATFNEYEALYSNAKAKELLGWKIRHHWRDQIY